MIEESDIREAYLALHRYMIQVGSIGRLAVPRSLGTAEHPNLQKSYRVLLPRLREAYTHSPGITHETYFVYCWLWSQLLRCSLPHGPTMVRTGEWRNLAWYPLDVLAGKVHNHVPSDNAWHAWYTKYVSSVYPHPDEKALRWFFPWYNPMGKDDLCTARVQWGTAIQLADQKDIRVGKVLLQYASNGQRIGHKTPIWHPWICTMIDGPEFLHTQQFAVQELLAERELADQWFEFLLFAVPNALNRCIVLDRLNRYVKTLRPHRSALVRWRNLNVTWAKHPDMVQARATMIEELRA